MIRTKLFYNKGAAIGQSAADSIQEIVASTQAGEKSLISMIIGVITLIFGAWGVFCHLQLSLNLVWDLKQDKMQVFKNWLSIGSQVLDLCLWRDLLLVSFAPIYIHFSKA